MTEAQIIVKLLPSPDSLNLPIPKLPFTNANRRSRSFSPSRFSPTPEQILQDALDIRYRVFVLEQDCAADNEVDEDDGRSWHWVAYRLGGTAFEGNEGSSGGRETDGSSGSGECSGGGSSTVGRFEPVACVRLIPPPHPPHPSSLAAAHNPNQVDYQAHQSKTHVYGDSQTHGEETVPKDERTKSEAGYIKLGRLAVLPQARRHGLARILCSEALTWARKNRRNLGLSVPSQSNAQNGRPHKEPERILDQQQKQPQNQTQDRSQDENRHQKQDQNQIQVLVHAQLAVEDVWRKLGFDRRRNDDMGEWEEENIMHCGMWKTLDAADPS